MAKKFKQYIANIDIIIKNALVKAYYFILSIIKHYYRPLQRVYSIIIIKISSIKPNLALQISLKIINNSIGLDGPVFTLLIFGVYLNIIKEDVFFPLIIQHIIAL